MDWTLFHVLNQLARHSGWAHGAVRAYAKYGVGVFAFLLAAGALVGLRRGPTVLARAVWAAGAALVALALNQPIANAADRARPFAAHSHVLVLVSRSADPSFMSDHAVVAGAVAAGLLFAVFRLGLLAVVAALIMGFARVYVGAHYPGDVAAGLAFGALVAAAGIPIADRLLAPLAARAFASPLARRVGISRPA